MFPDSIMNKIMYIEISVGAGLGMGPFIGSLVYSTLHYKGTIYLFACLNVIGLVLSYIYIPTQLN